MTKDKFAKAGMHDASIEAEVLIRYILNIDREQYFTKLDDHVKPCVIRKLNSLVHTRLGGEPLAYIIGNKEFYALEFLVTNDVLIPRPETELLVDIASDHIMHLCNSYNKAPRVIDICTGSGAIAISLAVNYPEIQVFASDISAATLKVAKRNSQVHNMIDRIHFIQADMLYGISGSFDIIVANPPYVPTGVLNTLPTEIHNEPRIALDGGVDGLDLFRRLLSQCSRSLRPNGILIVELMPEQIAMGITYAKKTFPNNRIESWDDLGGEKRALVLSPQI